MILIMDSIQNAWLFIYPTNSMDYSNHFYIIHILLAFFAIARTKNVSVV